jgi:elongation factor Tu
MMPGDKAELTVEPDKPVAMEGQSRFAAREGNRAAGAVTRIIE